jgi:hypothetical protein
VETDRGRSKIRRRSKANGRRSKRARRKTRASENRQGEKQEGRTFCALKVELNATSKVDEKSGNECKCRPKESCGKWNRADAAETQRPAAHFVSGLLVDSGSNQQPRALHLSSVIGTRQHQRRQSALRVCFRRRPQSNTALTGMSTKALPKRQAKETW